MIRLLHYWVCSKGKPFLFNKVWGGDEFFITEITPTATS